MDERNPIPPSLREAFRPERDRLSRDLSVATPPSEIVSEGRKALDRVATDISERAAMTPQVRKTALWLIEIVKSNSNLFDQGREARVAWRELPNGKAAARFSNILFFGGAAAMMVASYVFKNGGALYGIGALAALRLLDPKIMQSIRRRLPFVKRQPLAIEDLGARYQIEAQIEADPQAFLTHIDGSLSIADNILTRLTVPEAQAAWHDHPRLMAVIQNLLEAQVMKDSDYALKLIDQELGSLLRADGVELVNYSLKQAGLFDALPSLGETQTRMAAPALVKDGRVIRRGTIWVADK